MEVVAVVDTKWAIGEQWRYVQQLERYCASCTKRAVTVLYARLMLEINVHKPRTQSTSFEVKVMGQGK